MAPEIKYRGPFAAVFLLAGTAGIFLLAIVIVLMYLIVAPLEEREFRAHYGAEYEAYCREVPRFVSSLWRKTKPQISA